MFKGIKSKPNIISNQYTSISISNIFKFLFDININITIVEIKKKEDKKEKCVIGINEKCKECNPFFPENCLTCNEGYYLPLNEFDNKICLSCDNKIVHCNDCLGNKYHIKCFSCELPFYLENNKCIKKQTKEKCITGKKEKCKTCREEEDLIDQCETCNEGYYLSENTNKTECLSCNINIKNCLECNEEKKNLICNKCQKGYELINNSCIEKTCEIGVNEKCASCKTEEGRKSECKTCNKGYFISEENPKICSKCSIKNCKQCSFKEGKEICDECKETFEPMIDIKGNIDLCQCDYDIKNGLCVKPGNWIRAWADVDKYSNDGLVVVLIHEYAKINKSEIEVYVNGTKVDFAFNMQTVTYRLNKSGIYYFDININKSLTNMEWLFDTHDYYSVSFMPGFDCSQVTSTKYMFVNSNIESIDMKYDDVSHVKDFNYFIKEPGIVRRYEKLKEYIIDLSSFDASQVTICSGMFQNLHEDAIIKISNKFTKCKGIFH